MPYKKIRAMERKIRAKRERFAITESKLLPPDKDPKIEEAFLKAPPFLHHHLVRFALG